MIRIILCITLRRRTFLRRTRPSITLVIFCSTNCLTLYRIRRSTRRQIVLRRSNLEIVCVSTRSITTSVRLIITTSVSIISKRISSTTSSNGSITSYPRRVCTLILTNRVSITRNILLSVLYIRTFNANGIRNSSAIYFLTMRFSIFNSSPRSTPFVFRRFISVFRFFRLSLRNVTFLFVLLFRRSTVAKYDRNCIFVL